MELKQYVKDAIRTESQIETVNVDPVQLARVFSAFVASGTLLDMIKKNVFYKKPIDQHKWKHYAGIIEEIGVRLTNGEYLKLQQEESINVDTRVFHAVVGIATEATELVEALSNGIAGAPDTVNLQEEVGDLCWYQAILIDAVGGDWDGVLERNIAKLRARYPDKFTNENAINRDTATERKILEGQPALSIDDLHADYH